jgi:hypothetical protein
LALRQRRYVWSARVWMVWLGWWEFARVNCRRDPKWVSILGRPRRANVDR